MLEATADAIDLLTIYALQFSKSWLVIRYIS